MSRIYASVHATRQGASFGIDGQLLKHAIGARLGGVAALQDRLSLLHRDQDVDPPHRATIHRWMQGHSPRTSADLLSLCGALDLDPVCLLKLPEGAMERVSRAYLTGRWDPPMLEFVKDFLGRRSEWPPVALARHYFGRPWHMHEFSHPAADRTNYYSTIRIDGRCEAHPDGPFAYHFAFRHGELFNKRWLQYGWVLRVGSRIELRHINGHADYCESHEPSGPLRVQTWFGPGPAVFRVASLHPFDLEREDVEDAKLPSVRFPG